MKYPKVTYDHCPVPLSWDQHYISEIPSLVELEIDNYIATCWPVTLPTRLVTNYSNLTIHDRINDKSTFNEIIRYKNERKKLLRDRKYAFMSAYNNLVVFNIVGNVVPFKKQKYIM